MSSHQASGYRSIILSKTGLWPFVMAAQSLCRMILLKPTPLDAITKVRICIWYIEKAINGTSWGNNRSTKFWFSSNLTQKKPRLNVSRFHWRKPITKIDNNMISLSPCFISTELHSRKRPSKGKHWNEGYCIYPSRVEFTLEVQYAIHLEAFWK